MNTRQTVIDEVRLIAELNRREKTIQQRHNDAIQAVVNAFRGFDRIEALRQFECCLKWNELDELVKQWAKSLSNTSLVTYVCDGWFLQDLIRDLTPGADEEITHVTGARVGSVRVLSRLCRLTVQNKTPVFAKATARSCADTEIEILEHGNMLHAMAHSHPGEGAVATHPSSIDVNYLGRIQRVGSDAIGIIITRDGWVRFYSVVKPFRVVVMGSGVTQVEEHVFHIALSD